MKKRTLFRLTPKRKKEFLDAVVAKKETSKKLKEFIKMNKKKLAGSPK
jgi:hypothetical protein